TKWYHADGPCRWIVGIRRGAEDNHESARVCRQEKQIFPLPNIAEGHHRSDERQSARDDVEARIGHKVVTCPDPIESKKAVKYVGQYVQPVVEFGLQDRFVGSSSHVRQIQETWNDERDVDHA